MSHLLDNPDALEQHMSRVLYEKNRGGHFFSEAEHHRASSSVLVLISPRCHENEAFSEPCLILNKRSQKVRQPGDLCCPGGGVSPRADALFSKFLTLPGFPLFRWPYLRDFREWEPRRAARMTFLLATGLREGLEEMGLNPLRVRFLGALPPQHLRMFRRVIYPMLVWVPRQTRFVTNWEVDKIVRIPLRHFLNHDAYACYRLRFSPYIQKKIGRETDDFPCFLHKSRDEEEMLWGATYRIVSTFLELVLGFETPDTPSLPVISGVLDRAYVSGSRQRIS